MTQPHDAGWTADDVQLVENVLDDTRASVASRRTLLGKASIGLLGATSVGSFLAACGGGGQTKGSAAKAPQQAPATSDVSKVVNTAVTAEALAVTYLTGVVQNASQLGVSKFAAVLRAANAAEYDHYMALTSLGAKPAATRFWVPNDLVKKGAVFPTLEMAETLFVNAYLIGITTFARAGRSDLARYAGEIGSVEAEHLALARYADGKLPDAFGFMPYDIKSIDGIVTALERVGIGFGKQGSKPGKFYSFSPPPSSATTTITNEKPL